MRKKKMKVVTFAHSHSTNLTSMNSKTKGGMDTVDFLTTETTREVASASEVMTEKKVGRLIETVMKEDLLTRIVVVENRSTEIIAVGNRSIRNAVVENRSIKAEN